MLRTCSDVCMCYILLLYSVCFMSVVIQVLVTEEFCLSWSWCGNMHKALETRLGSVSEIESVRVGRQCGTVATV